MTGSYRKGNSHLGKAFGDLLLYLYQRAVFLNVLFFFCKLLSALTKCPASVFPTCSMCVNASCKFGQGKPSLKKTVTLRGACQKHEVSDAEWCKRVMQEADVYFSLLSHDPVRLEIKYPRFLLLQII